MTRAGKTTGKSALQKKQAGRFSDLLESIMERTMHLNRGYADAMLRLSPPEMRGLMWLGRRGRSVMTDFAQGMDVPLSTATRIVNRLVSKGIVVRHRSDEDRRVVEIDLSEVAYEHKGKFQAARQSAILKVLEPLALEEGEMLLGLLEKGLRMSRELEAKEVSAPVSLKKK